MKLAELAAAYQAESGCDDGTAVQAAFVMAAILADVVNKSDIGDYFMRRAAERTSIGPILTDPPVNSWARDRLKGAQGD